MLLTQSGAVSHDYTPGHLNERLAHSRAVEAIVWGMPAVNFDLMLQAAIKAGAKENQIVFWSRIPDWKNQ
ncbi:MAG: hypothetical protein E5V99_14140, partial [Mesorhizobium sp.]